MTMVAATTDWAVALMWIGWMVLLFCVCGALSEKLLFPSKPDEVWDDPVAPEPRGSIWDLMDEGGIDGEPSDDEIYFAGPYGGARYVPDTRDENDLSL